MKRFYYEQPEVNNSHCFSIYSLFNYYLKTWPVLYLSHIFLSVTLYLLDKFSFREILFRKANQGVVSGYS
jgi:hypothetical protein